MTVQLIPLLLLPLFLAADIRAIAIGRRGATQTHKLARITGITALLALAVFIAALVDLFTQVWVMRAGSMSGAIYLGSGVAFTVLSLAALALSVKLRSQRKQTP